MNWQEGEESGLVETSGQASLLLRSYGPRRETPNTPAIIVVHGLGGTYLEWLPTMKLLSKFARAYLYERAGYYPSEKATSLRTPSNIVAELRAMLIGQDIRPPYILVGHSYGGILVRQYLADFGSQDVAGVVLVDSVPDMPPDFPTDWQTLLGTASYGSVVGLDANHCFEKDEDYQAMMKTMTRNEGPGSIEEEELENRRAQELIAQLRGKQPLGNKPLTVIVCGYIHDFHKIYEHGVKHGNGTAESREALIKFLEDNAGADEAAMRTHLELSSNSRLVKATGKARTHNCQLVDASFVADEVKRVYQECMNLDTTAADSK